MLVAEDEDLVRDERAAREIVLFHARSETVRQKLRQIAPHQLPAQREDGLFVGDDALLVEVFGARNVQNVTLIDEFQRDRPADRRLPVALDGLDRPLHGLVHRLEIAHLLVDLVVFLNELLLDEHDVLFLKQRLDIGEAHVEIPHVPDDIEPRGLADVVVAVVRLLVPVARLQKSHPVVESERGDRNAVRLRHFADRQQMRAFFVVHFRPSVWQKL